MKIAAMFGSSSGVVGAAAGGAVLLVASAVGYSVLTSDADPETPVAPILESVELSPATPEAPVQPDLAEEPAIGAPLLDVVRVEPNGSTLIAGQTEPGWPVAILLDGSEVALVEADGAGDFVAFLTLEPSDAPRMISAEGRPEGVPALPGPESVLVAPFALASVDPSPDDLPTAAEGETVEQEIAEPIVDEGDQTADSEAASPEAAPDVDPETLAEGPAAPQPETVAAAPSLGPPAAIEATAGSTGPIAAAPNLATAEPSQPPAVLIAGPDGLRIAQGPGTPAVQTEVQLDAISYDASGAVILAGRGPATADIQVYLNNQPIQLGEVGANGAWSLQLPDVDPGTYDLVVAELAEDGTVESQVTTPFLREDPERVAEAPAQAAAQGIDVITVQPGFTLWGMAENNFGDGILYVQIFEENRDQIRDPNWIFPGQIFRMPEMGDDTARN
ncbi:hypothetical protein [Gymnodinialimonas hymeniacidonis]|uniref:LysM peptidoglycan-binding domain-containing protein n=1 Tax=Gymnodinialimonas hymeniacidonis TaxID=3126508 RepID=UPI0034C5F662